MKVYVINSFFVILILQGCVAPPVTQNKETDDKQQQEEPEIGGLEDYMEYHRYLKEVVNALESDPDFRKKLEKADEGDIKSGKIAEELEFVSHHVRTRLDEIKRIELNRLRELTLMKQQLTGNGIDTNDPSHGHVDHVNPHTFEIEDLKKLIAKTTEDLAEADRKRREEFKQYELQKEYEKQNKLNHTDGTEREKLEKELKEREEKHKKHAKLHEPGHKAQLEEVWEKQDQMQQEFNPKTFFMLHDVDGNGLWDQMEVKALFVKELEKMYAEGHPEDDMRERAEEMERMRETVFREVDTNRDGFIDFNEFLAQTRRNDFQQDHGWKTLDEARPYTDEELQEYIRQQNMRQMQQGYPYGAPPPHYGQPVHPQFQQPPQHYQQPQYHQQQQYHPADYQQPQFNQPPPSQFNQPPQFQHPQAGNQQYQHPQQAQYQQQPPPQQQQYHNVQPPPPPPQQQFQQQANLPNVQVPQQPNVQSPQHPNIQSPQQPSIQSAQQPQQPNIPQPQQPNVAQPQQPNVAQSQQPNVAQPQQPNVAQPQQPNVAQPQQPNVAQPQQPNVAQPQQPNVAQPQQPNIQMNQPVQNQQPLSNNIPSNTQNVHPQVNQI